MDGLTYFARQRARYQQLQETLGLAVPFGRAFDVIEWRFVSYIREVRNDLTPLERMELFSLRRELDILEPSRPH